MTSKQYAATVQFDMVKIQETCITKKGPETTDNECAILYGKSRIKYVKERMPLCANTVFSRIFHRRIHFYRVLPCKTCISRVYQNIRVLPRKSHIWAQNGPKTDPKMGLESLKTRVLPRFYTLDVHKTPCFTV